MNIFKRLVGYNFATYKYIDLPLYNQGVVSVEGRNLDTGGSNGSGKSVPFSLLLEHIIYGTTSCGLSGDSIIGNFDTAYYGILYWENNKEKYKVIQWRGKCKYSEKYGKNLGIKIFKNGISIEIGHSVTEIQKQVEEVLGISHEEFLGSVLLSGDDHVFLKGKPSERISFLSGPFRLYIYDAIQKEVKNDLSLLDERFRKLEIIQAKKERAEDQLNKVGSLRKINADLKVYDRKYNKAKKEIKKLRYKKDKILELITTFRDINIKELQSFNVKKSIRELEKFNTSIENIEVKIRKNNIYLEKLEEYWDIKEELDKTKKVDIKRIESRINKIIKNIAALESTYESSIKIIEKLSKIKGKKVCPTCQRKFSEKDINKIKDIVDLKHKENKLVKKILSKKNIKLLKLKTEKTQGEKYNNLKNQLPKLDKIKTVESVEKILDILEAKLKQLASTKDKLSDSIKSIKYAKKKLKQFNIKPSNVKDIISDAIKDNKTVKEKLEFKENILSNLLAKIKRIKYIMNERKEIEKEIFVYDRKLSKINILKHKEKLLRVLAEAYGPKGLKFDRIRNIIKKFQNILPKYTSILFNERNIKFEIKGDDKKLGFDAIRPKNKPFDIKALSKGEARRMNLALILMTKKAMPASKSTNMIILDEIDTNMDQIGKEALVNDLIPSLRKKINTILIISHNKEIAESPIFDTRWTAEKSNGISKMFIKERG